MPEEFGSILAMTVNELILSRCDEIQNQREQRVNSEIEKIVNSLSPVDQKLLDQYIADSISDNGDLAGKMYVQGFYDCISALKQAGKL